MKNGQFWKFSCTVDEPKPELQECATSDHENIGLLLYVLLNFSYNDVCTQRIINGCVLLIAYTLCISRACEHTHIHLGTHNYSRFSLWYLKKRNTDFSSKEQGTCHQNNIECIIILHLKRSDKKNNKCFTLSYIESIRDRTHTHKRSKDYELKTSQLTKCQHN